MCMTEKELEKILTSSRFTNETHKEALRKKLFEKKSGYGRSAYKELFEDDLELVAGGKKIRTEIPPGISDAGADDAELRKRMGLFW